MEDTNNSKTGSSDSLIHIMKTKTWTKLCSLTYLYILQVQAVTCLLQLLDQTKHFLNSIVSIWRRLCRSIWQLDWEWQGTLFWRQSWESSWWRSVEEFFLIEQTWAFFFCCLASPSFFSSFFLFFLSFFFLFSFSSSSPPAPWAWSIRSGMQWELVSASSSRMNSGSLRWVQNIPRISEDICFRRFFQILLLITLLLQISACCSRRRSWWRSRNKKIYKIIKLYTLS